MNQLIVKKETDSQREKTYIFCILFLVLYFVSFSQPVQPDTIHVHHKFYTIIFDKKLKSPLCSWYIQTTAHATTQVKIARSTVGRFQQDPLIPAQYQVANDEEYTTYNRAHKDDGLRKDRGHLAPYSAFNFDKVAATESMFYTNTAPQAYYFNQHPWEHIEQYVLKTLAPLQDSIYVYTGCLYNEEKMGQVPIPDYYWKVITYKAKDGKQHCQAWIGKNLDSERSLNMKDYVADLDGFFTLYHTYVYGTRLPFEDTEFIQDNL